MLKGCCFCSIFDGFLRVINAIDDLMGSLGICFSANFYIDINLKSSVSINTQILHFISPETIAITYHFLLRDSKILLPEHLCILQLYNIILYCK